MPARDEVDRVPQLADAAPSACENGTKEFAAPSYPMASCCICGDNDAEEGDCAV